MFFDRRDAGLKLGRALKAYKSKKVLVLAIPRGGIEVGYLVAKALKADFNILIVRKLPLPYNPEAGFGAMAEDGTVYMQPDARSWLSDADIKRVKKEQKLKIKERQKLRIKQLPSLKGKTVVLIDDGLAMGSTMIAAIKMCKKLSAKKVIVAVPVAGKNALQAVSDYADEIIVLETPEDFYAVAQVYYEWHDCTDKEVLNIMSGKA